jgi:hypothetical protein
MKIWLVSVVLGYVVNLVIQSCMYVYVCTCGHMFEEKWDENLACFCCFRLCGESGNTILYVCVYMHLMFEEKWDENLACFCCFWLCGESGNTILR